MTHPGPRGRAWPLPPRRSRRFLLPSADKMAAAGSAPAPPRPTARTLRTGPANGVTRLAPGLRQRRNSHPTHSPPPPLTPNLRQRRSGEGAPPLPPSPVRKRRSAAPALREQRNPESAGGRALSAPFRGPSDSPGASPFPPDPRRSPPSAAAPYRPRVRPSPRFTQPGRPLRKVRTARRTSRSGLRSRRVTAATPTPHRPPSPPNASTYAVCAAGPKPSAPAVYVGLP